MLSAFEERCAREVDDYFGTLCRIGWSNISQLQNELAAARAAVLWFAECAPPWARQPLVLDPERYFDINIETWPEYIHAFFSYSIFCRRYRYWDHPVIEIYGSGLMADSRAPKALRENPTMRALLPPRKLEGLDAQFCWKPLR